MLRIASKAFPVLALLALLKPSTRVKKYMDVTDFTSDEIPFLHIQKPDSVAKQYNVVFFLQESLGAEYVGSLGGLPLTPEFDKLTKEGLLFTNLFCTGTRSVRGIEAVVTGFVPNPSESVVKFRFAIGEVRLK